MWRPPALSQHNRDSSHPPPPLYHSLVHLPGSAHPVPEVFPEEIHRSPYPEHLLIFTETLLCAKDPRGAEMNEAMVYCLGEVKEPRLVLCLFMSRFMTSFLVVLQIILHSAKSPSLVFRPIVQGCTWLGVHRSQSGEPWVPVPLLGRISCVPLGKLPKLFEL